MLAVEVPIGRAPLSFQRGAVPEDTQECVRARRELARAKMRVPDARERMGPRRWNAIVNAPGPMEARNKGKSVINRAYHKMHEMALTCALPRTTRSLHLCEAPGGFVQCVADHLAADDTWTWTLVTLPVEDPKPSSNLPHDRGQVVLCDVMMSNDIPEATDASFDLVTADGAVEMDHARIEELHRDLLVAQCRIAMRYLSPGGTFVVKFFEGIECETRRVIAWISNRFENTSIIKPTSSRPTNSERYLICRGLLSIAEEGDWNRSSTSVTWDRGLQTALIRMADSQRCALNRLTASE